VIVINILLYNLFSVPVQSNFPTEDDP